MPADLSGTWTLLSSDNFEGYMLALGIDFATRKIAKLLRPQKVIEQNEDSFTIHTNSSLRNYFVKFKIGEEFEEDNKGLDNRKCKSLVTWDNDRLTCVQKGEKKNRGWTHWIEGDKLHLSEDSNTGRRRMCALSSVLYCFTVCVKSRKCSVKVKCANRHSREPDPYPAAEPTCGCSFMPNYIAD
ncbi:retinoid-binding protein 7 isoform X1 [Macaca nemestrina]|uniref:retinoid-binding protein 7 isoform X1 n=1 Tax=Macaca mulatta TaxID=9544 RepID=UPI0010A21D0F|nr:retinoid-binding protein 7 isoform X1 [Macaca mulatta]